MQNHPPKWAIKFLEKTCSSKYQDELIGDLYELFDRDLNKHGPKSARNKFIWKTLLSIRWYRLPGLGQTQFLDMWNNHFKMAYRHALKHKSTSAINFMGLLFGIAAAFYIGLFLKNELAYDSMHVNGPELYRVLRSNPKSGQQDVSTGSNFGKALTEEFSYISKCRFGNDPVKIGDESTLLVDEFYWSDSTFFEFFSFPLLHGNPHTCLDAVNSLVITESLSKQIFGTSESLDKTIKVKVYDGNAEFQMQVTGVVADLPKNSHIQFQALGAMANAEKLYANLLNSWGFNWLRTYIQVPNGRIGEIENGIPDLMNKHLGDNTAMNTSMSFQPFSEVYLQSQDINRNTMKGDVGALYIFGAIGILILLISLSNYINLATARAVTRSKEVGIRRVLGTRTSGIIAQFIAEAVFFTVGAGIVAILLMWITVPYLNAFLEMELSFNALSIGDWILVFLSLLALGIIAGLLPAISMSKLGFLQNAKSTINFKSGQGSVARKLFIGVQYLVTLVLLVSTFVIYQQYNYLRNFDLGFESNQLLHIAVDDRDLQQRLHVLKNKIALLPGVLGATATGEDLPSNMNNTWDLNWTGSNLENGTVIDVIGVDQDYFELMGIALKSGRNFTHNFEVDSSRSVVLNEQAQQLIGIEKIIGQQLKIGGTNRDVIGIVKNHHNTTLHSKPLPIAFFIFPPGQRSSPDNLFIKLEITNLTTLLNDMEKTWKTFSTDPFKYNFVDESFAEAYQKERKFSRLLSSFTIIAIFISLIGLFGLISFTTQLKVKEISIRRVLGASELNLMKILGEEFIFVFVAALVIALPLAVYLMKSWLANYAYHISLSSWYLILPAMICSGISMLVIFYHLRKTAGKNPGEILAMD